MPPPLPRSNHAQIFILSNLISRRQAQLVRRDFNFVHSLGVTVSILKFLTSFAHT